jgi:hypothetical protein
MDSRSSRLHSARSVDRDQKRSRGRSVGIDGFLLEDLPNLKRRALEHLRDLDVRWRVRHEQKDSGTSKLTRAYGYTECLHQAFAGRAGRIDECQKDRPSFIARRNA